MRKTLIIGVAGGTASGKTTVCQRILEELGLRDCLILSFDSYYKELTKEEREDLSQKNWDHPDALDFDLAYSSLLELMKGNDVWIPDYCFKTNSRKEKWIVGKYSPIVIFEGIYALYDEKMRTLMDLKIFVKTDDDIRLARRLVRDVVERNRTIPSILYQYNKFVKKSYDDFVRPSMKWADIIIPRGVCNEKAIDFIVYNL